MKSEVAEMFPLPFAAIQQMSPEAASGSVLLETQRQVASQVLPFRRIQSLDPDSHCSRGRVLLGGPKKRDTDLLGSQGGPHRGDM